MSKPEECVEVCGIKPFCDENDLHAGHMNAVANGKRKSHKGWTKWD
jgi:hypothetical protein